MNPVNNNYSIYKTDDDQRLVFGWASVAITVNGEQLEDRQQDIIDPEDLEEAAYEYVLNFRDTGEEHIPTMRKKGKLVESCVFTAEKQKAMGIPDGVLPVGWWIGFKIDDDDAWNRVKSGHYKMFSIEGKANRLPVEKGDSVAKSFEDILKYNDRHDPKTGRFAPKNGGYTAMSGSELARSVDLSKYTDIGIRALTPDEKYEIGDVCRESYDWDYETDSSTYETDNPSTLGGTCTAGLKYNPLWDEPEDFEPALNDALKLSQGYLGDRRVLVGGTSGWGGEDEGELIIGDAEVIAIYDSKSGKWLTNPPTKSQTKQPKQQAESKPKITREDIERYKAKCVDEYLKSHPRMNRIGAVGNLPLEQRNKISALQNYVVQGDEKWLKDIDISDVIVGKSETLAKSFDEILKFNPYHDARGRFSTANGYASFTTQTKDPKKQHWADKAVARMKQQAAQAAPQKPTKNYDKLGFADYDDADYHQLYNGQQYYQQQKLTAKQKQAATNYLEDYAEPGSMYSHSQNMNYMMATGQKLTGKYKQTHDGLMDSMHNVGYNVELTRYDHADMVDGMLKSLGAGSSYERMSQSQLQKALVGQSVSENKFLSTSYNNFKNAPQSTKQIFDSRAVKINYKVKADTQAMMPGKGGGGDFGEIVLAPTNGTANRAGTITDVRLTGQMVRRKGTQMYNQPRIEIDIEI